MCLCSYTNDSRMFLQAKQWGQCDMGVQVCAARPPGGGSGEAGLRCCTVTVGMLKCCLLQENPVYPTGKLQEKGLGAGV